MLFGIDDISGPCESITKSRLLTLKPVGTGAASAYWLQGRISASRVISSNSWQATYASCHLFNGRQCLV